MRHPYMDSSFNAEAWIEQELRGTNEANLLLRYISYKRDYRLIGGEHRRVLIQLIERKFPHKFNGGSR